MIEITGKISDDNECWCFEVDENTYKKIIGKRNYDIEKEYRKESFARGDFIDYPWRLYPSDIIEACGIDVTECDNKKVKIKISVEKI